MELIKQGHHPCFDSPDLNETKLFYCGLLGLKVAFEFRNDADEVYGLFIHTGNGTYMEFFLTGYMPKDRGPCRHYALEVYDIEATRNHLIEHGYKIEAIRRGKKDKVLQFFLDGPSVLLEFQQHDEQSALRQWEAGEHG